MKRASIFSQLMIKAVVPVVFALVGLALYNMHHTRELLMNGSSEKNRLLTEEIRNELEFQDYALGLIEDDLNKRIDELGKKLTNKYFKDTDGIEKLDLASIQRELNMNTDLEDIYVINKEGIIVNTTFPKDLNFDLFSLGVELKEFLLNIFVYGKPKIEAFSIENKTNKFKKYAYYPTLDGKYIIELGVYSIKASSVVNMVKSRINAISYKQESILSVDLFIGEENPISFNKNASISGKHKSVFLKTMKTKRSFHVEEKIDGKKVNYDFIYLGRKNSDLYRDSVIRIVSDRSKDDEVINKELQIFLLIFGVTLVTLFVVILFTTKSITDPLKKLVENVNRISEGNLNERASAEGSKEIVKLSRQFNNMLDKLEGFYNELEQKVLERTSEISQQKEEIEAQRDQIEAQRDSLVDVNKNLHSAYSKIELQNSRITDSIHYAKRIQTAVLPSTTQMSDALTDYFVFNRPKDIVSGDFYWCYRTDNKSIIVVADCTGHGVPGAFMSLIGNTLLNKIVKEKHILDPGEILTELSKEIVAALKQQGEVNDSKDGMDVSMCVIDHSLKTIAFAGANNPMYLIQNDELLVTKGDKQPVGYFIGDTKAFVTKTTPFGEGDMLYLFSDGYQDQFGGENDKKFMVGRFKRLLKEVSTKTCPEQREVLENTIDEWMFNTKQVDDILLIGIRM